MDQGVIDTALIDPNLSSYEAFFDPEWCSALFAGTKGTVLEDAVNALLVAWRATNGVHILPWLMVKSLEHFDLGNASGNLRFRASYSEEVVKRLVANVVERMETRLKPDQRFALVRIVTQIEKEAHEAVREARDRIRLDATAYWEDLASNWAFRFSVLGAQRTNYGSLFFTFEDFLSNVIRTKEPSFSSNREWISTAFARCFGAPLADDCWNHAEVDLARLVRNALVHNGGRYGTELDKPVQVRRRGRRGQGAA